MFRFCWHDWSMWGCLIRDYAGDRYQHRVCKKCHKIIRTNAFHGISIKDSDIHKSIDNIAKQNDTEFMDDDIQLESKTCANCKYYQVVMPENNPDDEYNYHDCCANDVGQNIVSRPAPSFGCNKFESRSS